MPHKKVIIEEEDDGLDRPLTPAERRLVRKMLEDEARLRWFWSSVRIWAGWISAAVIAAWSMVEIASKIWKRTL